MGKDIFRKEEESFMWRVGEDYVSIAEIYSIIAGYSTPRIPTKEHFASMLYFVQYLGEKYGKHFHYTQGPGDPINKSFFELLQWLQSEYDAGRYDEIGYGIWFSLDEEAMAKKYSLDIEDGVHEFLDKLNQGDISLASLYHIVEKGDPLLIPTQYVFEGIIFLIQSLFDLYGKHFHFLEEVTPETGVKNLPEFLQWLEAEYDAGRYEDIALKVLFRIDQKVISKKDLPGLKSDESLFLNQSVESHVSFGSIYNMVSQVNPKPVKPTKEKFRSMLSFVTYLAEKFGRSFHCFRQVNGVVREEPDIDQILLWLESEYAAGRYEDIAARVWFELDRRDL